jgi:hypothetical protein
VVAAFVRGIRHGAGEWVSLGYQRLADRGLLDDVRERIGPRLRVGVIAATGRVNLESGLSGTTPADHVHRDHPGHLDALGLVESLGIRRASADPILFGIEDDESNRALRLHLFRHQRVGHQEHPGDATAVVVRTRRVVLVGVVGPLVRCRRVDMRADDDDFVRIRSDDLRLDVVIGLAEELEAPQLRRSAHFREVRTDRLDRR